MMVSANSASLHARRTDDRRTERLEEAPHGSIEARLFDDRDGVQALGREPHEQQFEDAREGDSPGCRVTGGGEQKRQRQCGDQRHVEQNGRCRSSGEALMRIEDRGQDRHQRDEQKVRKGDAGQRHRQIELGRVG